MPTPVPYVEPTDASATIMRGVAAALSGGWMQPQTWPAPLVRLTGLANRLPEHLRTRLVSYCVRDVGIDPALAGQVSSAGLAQWAVDLYDSALPPSRRFDTIVIGAPSGGAGHLAAQLGAPFLSQSFVTRYRYRGHPDDTAAYQAFGARLGATILAHNPDLAVINHYDPVHDRFLLPFVNYIRMKLLDLPRPYAEFIGRRLRPGGNLLFLDCRYPWRQYRIAARHYFQVGGLGGVPDRDWVDGSPAIARFLTQNGRPDQQGWSLHQPWLSGIESEWGTLPHFRQAVEALAVQNGYRWRVLHGEHPADFSRLAFFAAYQALLNAGRVPAGVLVESFTLTSPSAVLRSGLLPLWLPFNCTDSLGFLRQMSASFPAGKPVLLAPAPAFSPSWDVGSAAAWQKACGADADVVWLGIDPQAYPVDLAGLFRFVPALQAWCAAHPWPPIPGRRLAVTDLEALLTGMAAQAAAGQPEVSGSANAEIADVPPDGSPSGS